MYVAYGWPQVIPLDPAVGALDDGEDDENERVVLLKVAGGLLLVVSRCHIEIWTSSQQHKVRVGKYLRDSDSIRREGEIVRAAWSPDTRSIALMTSMSYFQIFKVQTAGGKKLLLSGGKQSSRLSLVNISPTINEKIPFSDAENAITSNLVCDNKKILFGCENGCLRLVSWKAEFSDIFKLASADVVVTANSFRSMASPEGNLVISRPKLKSPCSIIKLELSAVLKLLVVLYSDGHAAICSVNRKGLKSNDSVKLERWLNVEDAVCSSIASDQQILAIGCRKGIVELFDLAQGSSHLRSVSLYDWGYSSEDTGPVSCISWTPENSAFAVGWKYRGLTVWSVSGCRLMCTIRQIGMNSASSPGVKRNHNFKHEPHFGGTSFLHWDEYGYKLYAMERGSSDRILGFSFGKCCLNRGLLGASFVRQVIYGEDRILVVQSGETDELKISHINLPVSYISQNWPLLHVVPSQDGMYLAIAGLHGLILYDLRGKRWRVFGDVSQEQKIECRGLLWLGKVIVVCNYIESTSMYELLFYPRYHLDQSSLLCRKQLMGRPIVMDVFENYILVTFHPYDVHVFLAKLSGELSPTCNPTLELSTVRELSIMTGGSHPAAMRFLPDYSSREGDSQGSDIPPSSNSPFGQPSRCLVLRTNGDLSLLDLEDGHERELTDSVEMFWVTCEQSEKTGNLIEEVSWLDYGSRGMQVWYPSPGIDPFKREYFLQLDPELEFDREVYPLGLLPSAGVVVGVSQRLSFSACTEFPCFEPSPQAQTILHCFLRHLLQRDKPEQALRLASLSAKKPHFSHCLEWLLFTVFDANITRPNAHKNQVPVSVGDSLLDKTCNLIRNFSEYLDVVVSVARKTDGRHWADLFSAAGRSTELFEECFQRRWYRTAACYILVIAKLEGPAVSQYCALRLLQATLDESLYDLAGELVRFLLRSGRDYKNATTESEGLSPRFLGYFLSRSFRKQSFDLKSASFKESNAHIASVKNILENHASYLMSGKELSKLVAFVKGTHFDLVEYLQRERMGSARLENFTAGLQLIGEKLRMDELQSRLDAEFLLAHMCSVKFKEWIVVLATLLRRTEVLYDIFHHDVRLWDAYSTSLRSQRAFEEYHDLLMTLEDRLSSIAD